MDPNPTSKVGAEIALDVPNSKRALPPPNTKRRNVEKEDHSKKQDQQYHTVMADHGCKNTSCCKVKNSCIAGGKYNSLMTKRDFPCGLALVLAFVVAIWGTPLLHSRIAVVALLSPLGLFCHFFMMEAMNSYGGSLNRFSTSFEIGYTATETYDVPGEWGIFPGYAVLVLLGRAALMFARQDMILNAVS
jgi:hypothetical protein